MSFLHSRTAALLAATAALTLTATPVLAQPGPYWHHHHHGDGGAGLLAALLIGGGVGAIAATAANNANKTPPPPPAPPVYNYETPPPAAVPAPSGVPAYPGGPLPGDDNRPVYVPPQADSAGFARAAPYTGPNSNAPSGTEQDADADRSGHGEAVGFDGAVDSCSSEIDHDGQSMGKVDNVGSAEDGGYRVEGHMNDGSNFACTMDGDGRIRTATVNGHAVD
ncbi:hypothetical protein [Novosphingobium sp. 9]|uniref:hypothetical protein n=1 Tax=Novosphingobium sp. 9 TaxID=2025349 RepID=UPI0021B5CAD8|nr:hypothetical protein [Novosphingobium sp. 9]